MHACDVFANILFGKRRKYFECPWLFVPTHMHLITGATASTRSSSKDNGGNTESEAALGHPLWVRICTMRKVARTVVISVRYTDPVTLGILLFPD